MNNVVIVGAGGLAREIVSLMRFEQNIFVGFLSDTIEQKGQIILSLPVLGTIEEIDKTKYSFICGVGSPSLKKKFVSRLNGANFITLNPYMEIANHISYGLENFIGVGTTICSGSSITTNVTIGNHVLVNLNCTIGHDVIIDDYVTMSPGCNISGNAKIGEGTELGTNVIVLPKIKIGKNSIIGAGAVVNKDIPDDVVAVGIPAKIIKEIK